MFQTHAHNYWLPLKVEIKINGFRRKKLDKTQIYVFLIQWLLWLPVYFITFLCVNFDLFVYHFSCHFSSFVFRREHRNYSCVHKTKALGIKSIKSILRYNILIYSLSQFVFSCFCKIFYFSFCDHFISKIYWALHTWKWFSFSGKIIVTCEEINNILKIIFHNRSLIRSHILMIYRFWF